MEYGPLEYPGYEDINLQPVLSKLLSANASGYLHVC
jgi:hypothetical protein